MPITQSAKKALRQSDRRHARNLAQKEAYKTVLKNFKKYVADGNKKEAADLLPELYKRVDKAAKTHIIEFNTASRLKSRATKLLARTS